MILDDGTDTDKVMIRAVNKRSRIEDIRPSRAYVQSNDFRSLAALLEYWNGPLGNDKWTFSIVDPESAIQEVLIICMGKL